MAPLKRTGAEEGADGSTAASRAAVWRASLAYAGVSCMAVFFALYMTACGEPNSSAVQAAGHLFAAAGLLASLFLRNRRIFTRRAAGASAAVLTLAFYVTTSAGALGGVWAAAAGAAALAAASVSFGLSLDDLTEEGLAPTAHFAVLGEALSLGLCCTAGVLLRATNTLSGWAAILACTAGLPAAASAALAFRASGPSLRAVIGDGPARRDFTAASLCAAMLGALIFPSVPGPGEGLSQVPGALFAVAGLLCALPLMRAGRWSAALSAASMLTCAAFGLPVLTKSGWLAGLSSAAGMAAAGVPGAWAMCAAFVSCRRDGRGPSLRLAAAARFLTGAAACLIPARIIPAAAFTVSLALCALAFAIHRKTSRLRLEAFASREIRTPSREETPESVFAGLGLAPREEQVACLLLEGLSVRQIAAHLGITFNTANGYYRSLYRKLGISSKGELFMRFGAGSGSKDGD